MANEGHQDRRGGVAPSDHARVARAARQLVGYANLLRWAANFQREELQRHPEHAQVMLLSPMQSGRFSFAVESETLYVGVQPFEAAWAALIPFSGATVSDRLYLMADGVSFMDSHMPPLSLGLFVDEVSKRTSMAEAKFVQFIQVTVTEGYVATVGDACGDPIPMRQGEVITQLHETRQAKAKQQDMGRFF
nr:hypothetical protein [uncultured Pseudomonas sp.]